MDGFCKFITSPDWWSVIATFITAIAAAWITYKLGKQQEKLQEQQIKLQKQENKRQEYEYYKDLYRFIGSIYYALKGVSPNILNNIYSVLPSDFNINRLKDYKGTIEKLRAQLYANEMEFNLKVKTKFDFYIYDDALECAEKIYNRIITGLTNNTIIIPNDIFCFNGLASDDERFNTLLSKQSEREKEKLEKYFSEFKKYQDEILNSGVLEALEKHCKID